MALDRATGVINSDGRVDLGGELCVTTSSGDGSNAPISWPSSCSSSSSPANCDSVSTAPRRGELGHGIAVPASVFASSSGLTEAARLVAALVAVLVGRLVGEERGN